MKLVRAIPAVLTLAATTVFIAGPGQAKSAFCSKVADIEKATDSFGTSGSFTAAVKQVKAAQASAPAEIKDDWRRLVSGFEKLNGLLVKAKATTDTKVLTSLRAEVDKITGDKTMTKSSDKITKWAKKECGINLH